MTIKSVIASCLWLTLCVHSCLSCEEGGAESFPFLLGGPEQFLDSLSLEEKGSDRKGPVVFKFYMYGWVDKKTALSLVPHFGSKESARSVVHLSDSTLVANSDVGEEARRLAFSYLVGRYPLDEASKTRLSSMGDDEVAKLLEAAPDLNDLAMPSR